MQTDSLDSRARNCLGLLTIASALAFAGCAAPANYYVSQTPVTCDSAVLSTDQAFGHSHAALYHVLDLTAMKTVAEAPSKSQFGEVKLAPGRYRVTAKVYVPGYFESFPELEFVARAGKVTMLSETLVQDGRAFALRTREVPIDDPDVAFVSSLRPVAPLHCAASAP